MLGCQLVKTIRVFRSFAESMWDIRIAYIPDLVGFFSWGGQWLLLQVPLNFGLVDFQREQCHGHDLPCMEQCTYGLSFSSVVPNACFGLL